VRLRVGKGARTAEVAAVDARSEETTPGVRWSAPPVQRAKTIEPRRLDHGGHKVSKLPAMIHAVGLRSLAIVEERRLRFDEPFGEGADRHDGVRAASSILKFAGGYLIAQDDSAFAAFWKEGKVSPLRLFPFEGADTFSEARGNKAQKPDLELGTVLPIDGRDTAVFFGSGSTDRRERIALVRQNANDFLVETKELPSLYSAAREALGIDGKQLNLEGSAFVGDAIRFFQRGNGGGPNASFDLSLETFLAAVRGEREIQKEDLGEIRLYDLGSLGDSPLGFTDATPMPDGRVLFSAAAEDSPTTFDDGAVSGSVIGLLDRDGKVLAMHEVPAGDRGPRKVEGLAIEKLDKESIVIRAVEDADDPTLAATALRLRFPLP
jgi:hypothetical protein